MVERWQWLLGLFQPAAPITPSLDLFHVSLLRASNTSRTSSTYLLVFSDRFTQPFHRFSRIPYIFIADTSMRVVANVSRDWIYAKSCVSDFQKYLRRLAQCRREKRCKSQTLHAWKTVNRVEFRYTNVSKYSNISFFLTNGNFNQNMDVTYHFVDLPYPFFFLIFRYAPRSC